EVVGHGADPARLQVDHEVDVVRCPRLALQRTRHAAPYKVLATYCLDRSGDEEGYVERILRHEARSTARPLARCRRVARLRLVHRDALSNARRHSARSSTVASLLRRQHPKRASPGSTRLVDASGEGHTIDGRVAVGIHQEFDWLVEDDPRFAASLF